MEFGIRLKINDEKFLFEERFVFDIITTHRQYVLCFGGEVRRLVVQVLSKLMQGKLGDAVDDRFIYWSENYSDSRVVNDIYCVSYVIIMCKYHDELVDERQEDGIFC